MSVICIEHCVRGLTIHWAIGQTQSIGRSDSAYRRYGRNFKPFLLVCTEKMPQNLQKPSIKYRTRRQGTNIQRVFE